METTFELNGAAYEIRFNLRACENFENIRGKSVVDAVRQATNLMMITDIRAFLSVGLYYVDGGRIPSSQASKIAEDLIEDKGLAAMTIAIIEALERDCSFLTAIPASGDTLG